MVEAGGIFLRNAQRCAPTQKMGPFVAYRRLKALRSEIRTMHFAKKASIPKGRGIGQTLLNGEIGCADREFRPPYQMILRWGMGRKTPGGKRRACFPDKDRAESQMALLNFMINLMFGESVGRANGLLAGPVQDKGDIWRLDVDR